MRRAAPTFPAYFSQLMKCHSFCFAPPPYWKHQKSKGNQLTFILPNTPISSEKTSISSEKTLICSEKKYMKDNPSLGFHPTPVGILIFQPFFEKSASIPKLWECNICSCSRNWEFFNFVCIHQLIEHTLFKNEQIPLFCRGRGSQDF